MGATRGAKVRVMARGQVKVRAVGVGLGQS